MKKCFTPQRLAVALATTCWLAASVAAAAKGKAKDKWVEQVVVRLSLERQLDGDSFGIELKTPKGNPTTRTYRLYGADCPESDERDKILQKRIVEQAGWFGRKPGEIPALGKEAAEFTRKLLITGKPRIFTRGKLGRKALKARDRPQRYYALVEVTGSDGKSHWLHELLIEAGLARAYGVPAAWPPDEEDRHGEKAACLKFEERLKKLESAAKRAGLGAWKKPDARPDT